MTKSQKVSFGRKSKSVLTESRNDIIGINLKRDFLYWTFGLCVHATFHITAEKQKKIHNDAF